MNEKNEVDTLDLMSRPGLIYLQFLIVANQSKCQFSILLANLTQNDKNQQRRKRLWHQSMERR
jgi:hypothetical protein